MVVARDVEVLAQEDLHSRVVFSAPDADPSRFRALPGVTCVEHEEDRIAVYGGGGDLVVRVVMALAESKIRFRELRTEQPTLEDVFLALTGTAMRE